MKKIIALLTVFAMIFAFAACNKTEIPENVQTTANAEQQEVTSDNNVDAVTDVAETPSEGQSEIANELPSMPDDPSQWTDEQIVEYYIAAAKKTHPTVKYSQTMSLGSLVIGEGGGVGGFFIDKVAMPAINSVLKKNSATFDGITGGYGELVPSDAKSLKAYKQGDYIVIEMVMKDQIDGKHGNNLSGTVGHAITVLGDISVAVAEFPQFEIDTDNADIKIHYNNASVKVKINKNGMIEKGTWKYIASVDIKNLDISGLMVKKANADIGYDIVVGGGF